MGQLFSSAFCSICGECDMSVVESVAVRTVTSRRESSLVSYTWRRSHKGSVPSTSSGGYHDVGLDDDSAPRELEGRRQEVAMFLYKELVMIPNRGGGHYYMPIGRFQQMQEDHYHDMYMRYMDQFDEDPTEQRAMRMHVQAWRFGGPPVAATVLVEDSEEDPEEDSMGTDDYVPRGYTPDSVDPENFNLWDEPASN
ncbi:hypothetical protein FNV43_RR00099 [Rhamnella rubrinervis]|uniref:Uncharacterized protein n=1 Tax=Rhamnella rubrinervis TaxID=2594499 RepID=A0A8K0HN19_9ROSA|nr:hypothetical protein FNV43_RR00099 [Rhamnella rubrinervis]